MRRTPEQLEEEFNRLYDCFETMTDCMFNADGSYWTTGGGRHVVTCDGMLAWVGQKKATRSQIVSGVREALNDTSEQLTHWLDDYPERAADALRKYRDRTGRDYWQDSGLPRKFVRRMLKRGRVLDDTEFRLLNSVVSDLDQKMLTAEEVENAASLLWDFEQKRASA